ncbi:phospholipid carrier-dependent glycosyltransferase [Clavibacter michiganensis]|uniref:dolichyl-phosphate-mannose--protein mannosyltransferase n=1 Tax=Clavibacter michiganensis TaxID=28447 RepID=UPI001365F3BE|nr:phospholipid carrier-dependent glycosyltransferase [Clavibacter michiganensis]MDO4017995.1 phospholipid carrier-dependent glycosyltransferase [Clavibacter michiganensis]MDO4037674.1 phospholipid carrier-dependent glycosyltransferase [Clavibacter michiganensis]MDO4041022.1 phospholipid carrier-dependent glycosyltransferase [Clavibacter michiganensis]MDO4050788.1 phospholipid carrier-dependent glycosyltransferase [Clavibacter michiganensis]MDO4060066.1 phospholipid carrier-dependent glycosylt
MPASPYRPAEHGDDGTQTTGTPAPVTADTALDPDATPTRVAQRADERAVTARGSRLDDLWARLVSTPARRRAWHWGGPIVITLLAAILRIQSLGHPATLVFDETFYVKDAWTLLHLGYEGSWPTDPNPDFIAGQTDGYLQAPAFVAHPPLGKWIIALGLAVFGAADPVGWRIATAVVGTLAVVLLMLIARRLTGSAVVATMAGFLFAIDGHAIVMSRIALLDTHVMFFGLLGFGAILLDRTWHERRFERLLALRREARPDDARPLEFGPVILWRPWLIAAGLAFGATSSVKWSGIFFLAGFGLYVVLTDMLLRRRHGLAAWFTAGAAVQGPVSFLLLVPPAIAAFLASYAGWFATSNGYFRNWAAVGANAWQGGLAWVPLSIQSLWHYLAQQYAFNVGLDVTHPYRADPRLWLLLYRPTQFYYEGYGYGESGCTIDACSASITSIANPIIWWLSVAAMLYLVYRLAARREWRVGLVLMGMVVGYLPWLLYVNRTVFQFYSIAFEPYLILCLAMVLGMILGDRGDPRPRRTRGVVIVGVILVVCALVSAFFYPLWTGQLVPTWFWRLHAWIPSGWI